jgi:hypothetical protein
MDQGEKDKRILVYKTCYRYIREEIRTLNEGAKICDISLGSFRREVIREFGIESIRENKGGRPKKNYIEMNKK